jgi:hypothetical protein
MSKPYQILSAFSPHELVDQVNAWHKSGYEPIGGVSAVATGQCLMGKNMVTVEYYQSVYKPPVPAPSNVFIG